MRAVISHPVTGTRLTALQDTRLPGYGRMQVGCLFCLVAGGIKAGGVQAIKRDSRPSQRYVEVAAAKRAAAVGEACRQARKGAAKAVKAGELTIIGGIGKILTGAQMAHQKLDIHAGKRAGKRAGKWT